MTTAYHAQYWAHALTVQSPPDSAGHLSRAISNARVDLNPHQVDAALFALSSPLSRGVILADEVGLGKTIEAALVISQRWAERRRHILIIVPASLRKQWQQELWDKFFLPAIVLERRAWNALVAQGTPNPFDARDHILICSYAFAAQNADAMSIIPWDLVVIDEAHRLRNVYKSGNKTGKILTAALIAAPKVLLTATPLQNSLMELYGLASVIDPHLFGDPASFRDIFLREPDEALRNHRLRQRLAPVVQRTLRHQVLEYVRFTQRVPMTQEFYPSDAEHELYEQVSDYLQRDELYAIPTAQRALMTMVLRKLLASSTFAIASTLAALLGRMRALAAAQPAPPTASLDEDFESFTELEDEWDSPPPSDPPARAVPIVDPVVLAEEIQILASSLALAESISDNAKGDALLRALAQAFAQTDGLGAPHKAVIFTESRRTQDYLFDHLTAHGYADQVVMLNGSNTAPSTRAVHADWLARHAGDGTATGARAVDVRAAVTEHFKERATILLATEAAAEGVNLQFCALVFNYDLPWNPQRVEQRIGRCHRYGQTHDVVVVNFLNQRNAADRRVLALLTEKFRLFEGVFGASDEVLGAVESGVDIERRIADIYQGCRTADDIATAFDILQAELGAQITAELRDTRARLLEHFDEDVHARLRVHRDQAQEALDAHGRMLLNLTRFELDGQASFNPDAPRFELITAAHDGPRRFSLDWREAETLGLTFYRVDHPLAVDLIDRAKARNLAACHLVFDLTGHGAPVALLEPQRGQSGWLTCAILTIRGASMDEFVLLAGQSDDGQALDGEWGMRLLRLSAKAQTDTGAGLDTPNLDPVLDAEVDREMTAAEGRNARYFDAEVQKLDRWSDDLKSGLERELKELDATLRDQRKLAVIAVTLADKLIAQREIQDLEKRRNKKRRDLYDEQDRIDDQRAELISGLERQLATTCDLTPRFTLRWTLT